MPTPNMCTKSTKNTIIFGCSLVSFYWCLFILFSSLHPQGPHHSYTIFHKSYRLKVNNVLVQPRIHKIIIMLAHCHWPSLPYLCASSRAKHNYFQLLLPLIIFYRCILILVAHSIPNATILHNLSQKLQVESKYGTCTASNRQKTSQC